MAAVPVKRKRAWWDKAAEEEEVFGPFGHIAAFKVSELETNRKGRVTCPVCAVQVHPDGLGLHLQHNSGCQSKQLEIETGQKRDRTFTCKKCNKRFWTEWDLEQHAGRCSWAVADAQEPRPGGSATQEPLPPIPAAAGPHRPQR